MNWEFKDSDFLFLEIGARNFIEIYLFNFIINRIDFSFIYNFLFIFLIQESLIRNFSKAILFWLILLLLLLVAIIWI
jgi:hypothetical protein